MGLNNPLPEHFFESGDVLLVEGTGPISRCIDWFENSVYSHAGLYVGGGIQGVIEATEIGVKLHPLGTFLKGHSGLCARRYPGLTVLQAEAIKTAGYGLVNEHYDYWQLITLGLYSGLAKLGIRWSALVADNEHKMICSEVVAESYAAAGIKLDKEDKLDTPASLFENPMLETIYTGSL